MKNTHIHDMFEALTPSEEQKVKMWSAICTQKNDSIQRSDRTRWPIRRKLLTPIAACILMLIISATAYAATDGKVISIIKNRMNQIFFANGETIELQINENGTTSVGTNGIEGNWLVEELDRRLILKVNQENINITDALLKKGYFYYDYRDNADVLHRIYILKNAGSSKDYSERWYSQLEWLPEKGVGGGSRGISGPLATAVMSAESDAANGKGDLDTLLQQYLEKYWNQYGD